MSDIAIGTIIGGYEILEEIGQGGMAAVYRAHQLSMNRDVAIKVLPRQFLRQSNSLDRFQQEAKIVARLEHRAIVPVHDYGEHDGVPYIVMRCMDGGSVDVLLANGAISPERTLAIVLQIAPALDYAHQRGVLHRDLKPSNILLDANGDAYVTDFGIARFLGEETKPLTTSGVVGTPSYMSPEQAQGHPLDGRSDVYALGVVLFEMLTGVRPFEGETPYTVAVKHVTEAPPSACALNPRLPRQVEQVLFRALEKKPDQRFQTANELAEALRMALEWQALALSPEARTATEPSLDRALREEAERRRTEASRASSAPLPAAVAIDAPRASTPDRPAMPPYGPPSSRVYPRIGSRRPVRRSARQQGGWLTWAMAGLVIGSIVLALLVSGVYYLINDPVATLPPDQQYAATAIFKMTATRQAILEAAPPTTPPPLTAGSDEDLLPTIPPTNTRAAAPLTPTALLLPGS